MIYKSSLTVVLLAAFAAIGISSAQSSRDYIHIVGSSTVYPLALTVAERFNQANRFKPPQIQSTGTGSGLKLFCAGSGADTPDIVNASRPIQPAEVELCAKNGVKEIVEVKFGYDAVVIAQLPRTQFPGLARKELFLALAKDVPEPQGGGKLVPNPYKSWKDINPALPNTRIQVWGPNAQHGTHDFLLSHIMTSGCKQFEVITALEKSDPAAFQAACQTFRKDGAYSEFSDYETSVQAVRGNPDALAIMGYALMLQYPDLRALPLDGIEPSLGSVSHQKYPVTRTLLLYVKKAHADVPGLKDYLAEFTSDSALSASQGYLFEKGMIPMLRNERKQAQTNAEMLTPLVLR